MKGKALGLLIILAAAALWIVAQSQIAAPLASYFPGGPLLYMEARDFSVLLKDWNNSGEKKLWLASDNYSVFSRSRLLQRLEVEQQGFSEAAGLSPDMSLVSSVAGGQSALAIYDIGKLEFLYITRLPSAAALETLMGSNRPSYESRSSAGKNYFVRSAGGKTSAFGATDGLLLLATREDLIANALALIAKQGKVAALPADRWYTAAATAAKAPGEVRMVFHIGALVNNTYFRSYWIQRNRSELTPFYSGVADLFREAGQIREERVLLREQAAPTNAKEGAAGQLLAYAPPDSGLSRVWAAPASGAVLDLLQQKILSPGPQTRDAGEIAPAAATLGETAGSESDLETAIDQPPLSSASSGVDLAGIRALLERNAVDAMLHVQTSRRLPDGIFLTNDSAVVLLAPSNWPDAAAIRALFPGSPVEVQGRILAVATTDDMLKRIAARLAQPASPGVTYSATYLHQQELAPYLAMMRMIDAGKQRVEGAPPPGSPREPQFFSDNVGSFGSTLKRMTSASITVHDTGNSVAQQVVYKLAP